MIHAFYNCKLNAKAILLIFWAVVLSPLSCFAGFANLATHGSRSSLLTLSGDNATGNAHIFPLASNGVKKMEFFYTLMDVSFRSSSLSAELLSHDIS